MIDEFPGMPGIQNRKAHLPPLIAECFDKANFSERTTCSRAFCSRGCVHIQEGSNMTVPSVETATVIEPGSL
jgi:hypothetical protein